MKEKERISQLMLELYHLDAVTKKERRLIETMMNTDNELLLRYEKIKASDQEFSSFNIQDKQKLFTLIKNDNVKDIKALNKNRKILLGIGIAAVLLCIFIPSLIIFMDRKPDKVIDIVIDSGTEQINTEENVTIEEQPLFIAEDIPSINPQSRNNATESVKTQRPNNETEKVAVKEPEIEKKNNEIEPIVIAEAPNNETGIRLRGGSNNSEQTNTNENQQTINKAPEQTNLNIPPGISIIFDGMFANRQLTEIIIPERITKIGKNAFAGNPVTTVTLGANITIDDDAIPGNFSSAYNRYGKVSGTYIRANEYSNEWSLK